MPGPAQGMMPNEISYHVTHKWYRTFFLSTFCFEDERLRSLRNASSDSIPYLVSPSIFAVALSMHKQYALHSHPLSLRFNQSLVVSLHPNELQLCTGISTNIIVVSVFSRHPMKKRRCCIRHPFLDTSTGTRWAARRVVSIHDTRERLQVMARLYRLCNDHFTGMQPPQNGVPFVHSALLRINTTVV